MRLKTLTFMTVQTICSSYLHFLQYIHFKAPCKGYWELNRHYLTASDLARKVNEENRDLYAYLRKHTGLNVTEFEQVSDLFDTLRIQVKNP